MEKLIKPFVLIVKEQTTNNKQ